MANPEETPEPPLSDRVDSWKEIAQYLDRDLRTVQRWEKERSLPVHRSPGGKRGVIYAMKPELDDWWKQASILDQDDAATGLAAGREEDLAKRIRRWKRLTFVLAALAAMSTILAGVVMWLGSPKPRSVILRFRRMDASWLSAPKILVRRIYGYTTLRGR